MGSQGLEWLSWGFFRLLEGGAGRAGLLVADKAAGAGGWMGLIGVLTMRHRAWLAWWSPPRLSRWRVRLPEGAGIGATPRVGPGGPGTEPFRMIPRGDQEQCSGLGAHAVEGGQARARTVTGGTMRSSRRSIWPSRNSLRRPGSGKANRVA
jgi:hypothetical protein